MKNIFFWFLIISALRISSASGSQIQTKGIADLAVTNAKVANSTLALNAKSIVNVTNTTLPGYSTSASTGTITLTNTSAGVEQFTGAGATTVKLPVVSTLSNGATFVIINSLNSNTLIVQSSGGNQLTTGFGQGVPTYVTIATVINNAAGTGTSAWTWTFYSANNTAVPLTAITGVVSGTLTPPGVGTYNLGTNSLPFGSTNTQSVVLYNGSGDNIGSLTQANTGMVVSSNYGTGGTFFGPLAFTTANNGSGPSGSFTFTPGTASTGVQGQMKIGGHVISSAITTAPTITAQACVSGTPAISGTDVAAAVTMATTCTSATVTFGQAYTTAPICVANVDGATGIAIGATSTTTTLVLTGTFATSSVINYICVGN